MPKREVSQAEESLQQLILEYKSVPIEQPSKGLAVAKKIKASIKENIGAMLEPSTNSLPNIRKQLQDLIEYSFYNKVYPFSAYSNNWREIHTNDILSLARYIPNQIQKLSKKSSFNPKEISRHSKLDDIVAYFVGKLARFDDVEKLIKSTDRPSLEEVHQLYYNIKKSKNVRVVSGDSVLFASGNAVVSEYFNDKLLKAKIREYTELDYQAKNGDGAKLGQDPEVKKLDALLQKDPQIVAREINKALKGSKGNGFEAGFDEETMAKVLFENCTLEQSYKAALIGEELAKLRKNGGKATFTDNIKLFCKSIASVFSSKYKVNDKVLSEAAEAFKVLSERQPQIDGSKTKNNSSKLKKAIGEFTKNLLAAREAKSKSKNSGQQSI